MAANDHTPSVPIRLYDVNVSLETAKIMGMCGRISFNKTLDQLAERFKIPVIPEDIKRPRFNIPPSTLMPVVIPSPAITFMKWGLTEKGFPINLRTDQLLKGHNKNLLATNRCIIPADGFYEWNPKKEPTRFEDKYQAIFPLAGVYTKHGFSLFTCEPNSVVSKVHTRMPVILRKEAEDDWLDKEQKSVDEMFSMLLTYPDEWLEAFPVDKSLNKPKNDYFKKSSV